MTPFHFTAGKLPLLVSIPHAGTQLTPEVDAGLSEAARGLPDTDWHIPLLYDFVRDLGASVPSAGQPAAVQHGHHRALSGDAV